MEVQYIFFKTDASFSYEGPFGTQTEVCEDAHGFSIVIDSDNVPDISTLRGFGAFEDVENCKNLTDLYVYIEENKKYINDGEFEDLYSTEELLDELQKFIQEALLKEIKDLKIA